MSNTFPVMNQAKQFSPYLNTDVNFLQQEQQQQIGIGQQQSSLYEQQQQPFFMSSGVSCSAGFVQPFVQQDMQQPLLQQQDSKTQFKMQKIQNQQQEQDDFWAKICNNFTSDGQGKQMEMGLLEECQSGWKDLYPELEMSEWVPVDTFFDDYINTLTNTEKQQRMDPNQQQQQQKHQLADEEKGTHVYHMEQQNAKPQVLSNRQAQKRYRERLKKKNVSLENAMHHLQAELHELRNIRQQNQETLARTKVIEQQLDVDLETQITHLKSLKAKLQLAVTEEDEFQMQHQQDNGEDIMDLNQEAQRMVRQFHVWIAELSQFLMMHGALALGSVPSDGSSLCREVVSRIDKYVKDVGLWCIRAQKIEGVDIWGMVMSSMGQGQLVCRAEEEWLQITQRMGFSDIQQQKLVVLYQEYYQKMEGIIKERQRLNVEITRCLLPDMNSSPYVFPLQQFSISTGPSRQCTNRTQMLMENLKENMRAEQRLYSGLDYVLFSEIFTPLQAAWFYLALYPEHCDCVGLLNAAGKTFKKPECNQGSCMQTDNQIVSTSTNVNEEQSLLFTDAVGKYFSTEKSS
eukprot:TRINITY_DN12958_c0_g5_i1.p1 TRINITY_DN12958_c0_g5~~TRINITY_DN12958_c0_g5_i1.p1  ORF type:complete len:593 (+),score=67.79 TRINITY_DN12958_c0_g5_i1:69-1781(+)